MSIEIKVLPIVREKDGLAMSSRNSYLSEAERRDALVLYQSLKKAESLISGGETDTGRIIKMMRDAIASKPSVKIEYVSIVDAKELVELETITKEALIAVAAHVGKTRLIDNIIVKA